MKAYARELVLSEGAGGHEGRHCQAPDELAAASIPDSFIPASLSTRPTPKAHFETTGPEIRYAADTDGGWTSSWRAGTGGTITGVGEYLKSKKPEGSRWWPCEPATSPVLSKGYGGRS